MARKLTRREKSRINKARFRASRTRSRSKKAKSRKGLMGERIRVNSRRGKHKTGSSSKSARFYTIKEPRGWVGYANIRGRTSSVGPFSSEKDALSAIKWFKG